MADFNPELPVQTRDGRKARILCTDLNNVHEIAAAVLEYPEGPERLYVYNDQGVGPHGSNTYDLINTPAIPKGLRNFVEPGEEFALETLIEYLTDTGLVVVPREATEEMHDIICTKIYKTNIGHLVWTAAIKAWEEET